MSVTQPGESQHSVDIEARLAAIERDITTLTVALEAASRMRISTPSRISPDIRVAGGKNVRRILENGGLVSGYPERPGQD